jgi:hypothetical protein
MQGSHFESGATTVGIKTFALPVPVGSAAPLEASPGTAIRRAVLRADPANTANIWYGYSEDVTPGTVDATDGMVLQPGDSVPVEAARLSDIWVVAAAAGQYVYADARG